MRLRVAFSVMLALVSCMPAFAAAPETPQGVVAVVAGNTVTLTWQAPIAGSAPLGYLVEAALSPSGSAVAAFLVIEPSLVLNGVPNGVYYVRVRAGNAEGISAPSGEAVAAVPGSGGTCTSPPDAPSSLSADVSGSLVTLDWVPPTTGCAPTGYVVQAGLIQGASDLAVINAGPATTISVSAPPGGYWVRVVAVNSFGASLPSNDLRVVVPSTVATNLTGVWSGTSNYINAPFEMALVHTSRGVGGSYQDQKDFGGVSGQVTGNQVVLDVNFGDTGIRFFGTIASDNLIRGTILVPVLGSRLFTFEMTR